MPVHQSAEIIVTPHLYPKTLYPATGLSLIFLNSFECSSLVKKQVNFLIMLFCSLTKIFDKQEFFFFKDI